ncbi:MAG: type II secretion system F family protein [Candidatus Omnitrophota bacterium]
MYWTYSALTRSGQEVTATLVGSRKDILHQLSQRELSVIEIKPNYGKILSNFLSVKRLSALSSAVFFEDFHNMLETGMSVGEIISIFKETSQDETFVMSLSSLEEALSLGKSLTEALAGLNIFPWIVNVTLSAGERSGRLTEAVGILGNYFRRAHQVHSRIQQALIYPVIVFILILSVMLFISLRVIPQLKSLLPSDALANQTTKGILFLSFCLQQYSWILLAIIVLLVFVICYWYKKNHFSLQRWLYRWPVLGEILKESALALYLLNLSVLLKSGVVLFEAIYDLNLIDQTPVGKHFMISRDYMFGGASFGQALERDEFFPKIVSSTFRRAEEMVKVDEYCLILSDFFYKRTSSKVDGLIHIVQPGLLAFGGMFLVVIALGFLLPIYSSLTTIAAGGN